MPNSNRQLLLGVAWPVHILPFKVEWLSVYYTGTILANLTKLAHVGMFVYMLGI